MAKKSIIVNDELTDENIAGLADDLKTHLLIEGLIASSPDCEITRTAYTITVLVMDTTTVGAHTALIAATSFITGWLKKAGLRPVKVAG